MGFLGGKGKGKHTPGVGSSRAPPPLPPGRVMRERLNISRIPVPTVPRSQRAHAEEVRRRRELMIPAQRRLPAYAPDSPNWEVWFSLEHEEERHHGVQYHHANPLPPSEVEPEEEEEAYQAVLAAAMQSSIEETRRKEEEEEAAYQARLAEALAPSAAGDYVIPPSLPRLPEPKAEPPPMVPVTERYVWTGGLREWVSAPAVLLGATPAKKAAYLDHYRARALAEERAEGERLMQAKREAGERHSRWAREEEDARHEEEEEERRARGEAVQPAQQP
nr:uncharacterized protein LOC109742167 [Aegilops tauschii subsp. strangulata]